MFQPFSKGLCTETGCVLYWKWLHGLQSLLKQNAPNFKPPLHFKYQEMQPSLKHTLCFKIGCNVSKLVAKCFKTGCKWRGGKFTNPTQNNVFWSHDSKKNRWVLLQLWPRQCSAAPIDAAACRAAAVAAPCWLLASCCNCGSRGDWCWQLVLLTRLLPSCLLLGRCCCCLFLPRKPKCTLSSRPAR